MRIKQLISLLLLVTGATVSYAQTTIVVGNQVTQESDIVSGKAYVLQYVGNNASYVNDASTYYNVNNISSATEASVYFFYSTTVDATTTWKLKNYSTGKYWGSISGTTSNLTPVDEADAGSWTLNMSGGQAYPKDGNTYLSRSGGKLHGLASNSNSNFRIYEIGLVTPPENVTTGWYQLKWVDNGNDTNTDTETDVAGNYVRNYATDVTVSGSNYPLYMGTAPTTIDENAASLVYFYLNQAKGNAGVDGYLRSANGHYISQTGAASETASSLNYIIYKSKNSYPNNSVISSGTSGNTRQSLVPRGKDATSYIGQTVANIYPMVQFYAVNPAYLGLDAWQVVYSGSGQVTCDNSNLRGLNKVYNGGTFFFTTGTTPSEGDFTYDDAGTLTKRIDASKKRVTIAADVATLTASDIDIIQGNETTGKGNTQQALLRMKLTPSTAEITPTALSITLSGIEQLDNVAIYRTAIDELHAAAASPVKISTDQKPDASINIPLTTDLVDMGETVYLWVTADVKSTATEWETIDATVTSITYDNWAGSSHPLDLTAAGNPDGTMRIFKQQTALWTPDHANTKYYRIPTMLNTADGGIVALTDYRHDHPYDLGKNASNGAGAHVVDVVARRSTDGGLTWQDEVVVAAGDGTNAATYGFGDPAIVRDADGTLHCLMAAGNASYASGMLHVGYSKSTDNGATWSTVSDIYSAIDKGDLDITSAFVTGGKGVTFANGRMAFAFLGKVSGTTNIYPFYSDDKGATWHIQPTVAYSGGDESKLEIMNDNSLLLSVRKGSYNGTAVRSYNRTTGDASAGGIANWGTAANWGSEMNANGCNADILYYNRSTEDVSRPDVIFHTLTKAYSTYRKDLRLYMSFDQGATWQEAFQLQAGYAAYSSMQKLDNGDLAIIFEDGSIGNKDKQDCYAINYIVISKEKVDAKIDELVAAAYDTEDEVKVVYGTTGHTSYGELSGDTWSSNASSGLAGVTLTKSDGEFNKYSNWNNHFNLAYKPAVANTASTLTLTAPSGYVIMSYSLLAAKASSASHTYTLMAEDGTTITPAFASSESGYTTLSVNNVNAQSTTISVTTTNTSYYLAIADFVVTLKNTNTVALNAVGDKSYATLYLPYDVSTDGETKAYYITSADNGYAKLTEVTNNEIPAYTAVILVNDQAATSTTLTCTDGLTQQVSQNANLLKGTLCSRPLDLSDATTYYSMGRLNGEIGFYKYNDGTITLGANKAYLDTSASGGNVKGFLFNFGSEDAINDIENAKSVNDEWYDLSGRRVKRPGKGIFINGGKKVMIK